jgi:glycosyltransferase involved in cell wall biosynthesis
MKFSIVTPSWNSEKYISETIESIISQKGNFDIECIFVDNLSTDQTIPIIQKYEKIISENHDSTKCNNITIKWISEKDFGMYSAINKGFSLCTGDVLAWINSDDIYLPGAFNIVEKVFNKYSEISWLKGITSYINEDTTIYQSGQCLMYNQKWIQKGLYGREAYFIQQDSVFWRSDLWHQIKPINSELRLAGDYDLWIKFAQVSPLYSVKAYLSCFRKVDAQLSQDKKAYRDELDVVLASTSWLGLAAKFFFKLELKLPRYLRPLVYLCIFGKQENFLIDLIDGVEPNLKIKSYYIAD